MATLQDFRNERLRKLEELRRLGVNPYPAKADRTNANADIKANFDKLEGKVVSVVGRIKNIRKMGKIGFIVIKDESDSLQLFLSESELGVADYASSEVSFSDVSLLDSGDFVEGTGEVIKTKTGEVSVKLTKLRILTKAIRPMPLAHEEFSDKEQRLRRRYVDLNVNQEVHDRFVRRSNFWQSTRNFLLKEGFLEINVPVLEHTTGGADANPFVTHMDALDQDFYLRISHELPLKRLLGGGYEKVFDIGPRFRNENYSDEHLPEHIAMEWYWAYADWNQGMELTQRMVRFIADNTWGTRKFKLANGQEIDLGDDGTDWPKISFVELLKEKYGLDVHNCTLEEAAIKLEEAGGEVEKAENRSRVLDKLWKLERVKIAGPAFLVDVPDFLQPLAKLNSSDARLSEQFNLLLGGTEACKAYSELNDPVDQLDRFLEQQKMRDNGDEEAMMLDIDFVEMLEYGMPPACGYGHAERLFWILEGVTAREGVIFPQLRMEVDETTKKIYPEVKFDTKSESIDTKPTPMLTGELPESADKHGTYKIYLNDWSILDFEAVVKRVGQEEGQCVVVLDQTAFYPNGGGQACDLGEIIFGNGSTLKLSKVTKDKDGVVYHYGELEGEQPNEGEKARGTIDGERRLLNSRLHCAGHFIDLAVRKLNKDWKPGKGAHYPEMSFVEYVTKDEIEDKEAFAKSIEEELNKIISKGGEVSVEIISSKEVVENKISDYIPQFVLDSYQKVHVVNYPDNFKICCGGTHVQDISDIGKIKITKVKKKDGNIRVSYELG
ncbi:MAG: lysyl-tRNA synthetase, class [Patescibacteria group bacterium]|nr:lysyl-tRNA synthetase, class [Patescibacteria group bacterium]